MRTADGTPAELTGALWRASRALVAVAARSLAAAATRLCDRLVGRDLVHRAVHESNRRGTTITLSAAGRRLVDSVTDVRRRELRGIVERIPEDLRGPAIVALAAFTEAAGEPPPEAWTMGWS